MAIVTSKDGLILREKPQKSSQKLELIEFAQSVEIQPQKKPISETVDGISGEWLETHYSGSNGFIFSAYVRRFAEIAASVESLDEGRLYGVWQNQKFVDYTKKPVTQLNLKPNRQFQFTIFAGGDGGGFGTKSLEGTWRIENNQLILIESKTFQKIRYALFKQHLILAEEFPSAEHRIFLENFDAEYPGGLSR
ncbi:hypothetical protein [Turneriella parva]|nr:hypothetical protein [Turneriella parva]